MKRIRFTRTELFESEGRNKGPTYSEGSTHDFEDDFAERWLRRGAAVEVNTREPMPADPEPEAEQEEAEVALSDHTVVQLRQIAADEEIDLGDATLKADIISAIELAREEKAD